jgi:hypothetical protein
MCTEKTMKKNPDLAFFSVGPLGHKLGLSDAGAVAERHRSR